MNKNFATDIYYNSLNVFYFIMFACANVLTLKLIFDTLYGNDVSLGYMVRVSIAFAVLLAYVVLYFIARHIIRKDSYNDRVYRLFTEADLFEIRKQFVHDKKLGELEQPTKEKKSHETFHRYTK